MPVDESHRPVGMRRDVGLNRDQGLTIVMVTHEADIAAHADRTVTFVDGHIETDSINLEAA